VEACGPTPRSARGDPDAYDDVARRYRTLIEQLPLVVYVDALDATSSNIFTSAQVEPLLGYTTTEWADDANLFVRVLHPDDRDRVLAAHAHTHATNEPLSIEYRLIAKDGHIVWIRDEGVVVVDDDHHRLYLQGYLLDITSERTAQEQLRQMALYDALTGLANRAFFHEQLQHTASVRKRPGEQTVLLFVDLNDFKNVNDRWGHEMGDKVLAALGLRVQETLRAGDVAARLGGDEFAVLIPAVDEPAEAARVAERLLEAIGAPMDLDGTKLSVTASIGISLGDEADTMLQEADAAMYRAKAQQVIGYAFFETDADSAAVRRSRRFVELREAVEDGQFTLDYQPLIDLAAHEIAGYEALIRWHHPTHGRIAPLDFIPLAEESGLIIPIGKWVLEEACRYGVALRREMGREIRMSINVSARQLQHPDFTGHVDGALDESGFPARCLTLELTESVLLATGDHTAERLAALKSRGITLALDDFGTGYASLSYLQRFPVDIVKIDRSFVNKIASANADLMLLKGIVDLGEALGLSLIAEGIETQAQLDIVRDLGCQAAQGFYLGRPAAQPLRELVDDLAVGQALKLL
jgi:diguanylate cyclase (GGDEF)-like protein/PAS domain S-box-containing protein